LEKNMKEEKQANAPDRLLWADQSAALLEAVELVAETGHLVREEPFNPPKINITDGVPSEDYVREGRDDDETIH
jgi:hypothetical protein